MLILGIAMWALNRHAPVLTLIPAPWSLIGWGVMAIAPIAPVIAFIQFARAHTTPNPHTPEAASALVTTGIYAWTRNPMYLGLSMLLAGWAVRLGTLSPLLGPVLFIVIIRRFQIFPEEHALRARFGEDYDQYCRRVHRWLGPRGRS
jgi:protein-S-isoprenylcysteine O-methyltransferase Ste14